MYTYDKNEPVNHYDPSGHSDIGINALKTLDWLKNNTSAGKWIDKKGSQLYNYVNKKAPVVTGICDALKDEAVGLYDLSQMVNPMYGANKFSEIASKAITNPSGFIDKTK